MDNQILVSHLSAYFPGTTLTDLVIDEEKDTISLEIARSFILTGKLSDWLDSKLWHRPIALVTNNGMLKTAKGWGKAFDHSFFFTKRQEEAIRSDYHILRNVNPCI